MEIPLRPWRSRVACSAYPPSASTPTPKADGYRRPTPKTGRLDARGEGHLTAAGSTTTRAGPMESFQLEQPLVRLVGIRCWLLWGCQ